MQRHLTAIAPAVLIALTLAACGSGTADENGKVVATDVDANGVPVTQKDTADTLVDTIEGLPDTKNFMAALTASGVGETIAKGGPYTVFVPADSAFDTLPAGSFDLLLEPESKARLASVIQYHVVPGALRVADLRVLLEKGSGSATIRTLAGSDLTLSVKDDMIALTDNTGKVATLGASDISAGNGTVHLIDQLLMPSPG